MPHLPALTRYSMYVAGNREEAHDLVQETFYEAWRCFDRYEPGTNCKAWLFRIFRNLLSKKRRRDYRHSAPVELDALEQPDTVTYDGETEPPPDAIDSLQQEEILKALHEIQAEYRETLLLLLEGLSYQEIADTLQIPQGTVMSRISRGRDALRKKLDAWGMTPTEAGKPAR